jgi:hypothetical protein
MIRFERADKLVAKAILAKSRRRTTFCEGAGWTFMAARIGSAISLPWIGQINPPNRRSKATQTD